MKRERGWPISAEPSEMQALDCWREAAKVRVEGFEKYDVLMLAHLDGWCEWAVELEVERFQGLPEVDGFDCPAGP